MNNITVSNGVKWIDLDKLKKLFENKFMKDGILEQFINEKLKKLIFIQ